MCWVCEMQKQRRRWCRRLTILLADDDVDDVDDRIIVELGFEQKFLLNPWVWVRSGWVFKPDLFNSW
jgi:hypothetical protein